MESTKFLWFYLIFIDVPVISTNIGCQLPIKFTYFQKATGFYCQTPSQYLESQYGGSFSQDTRGIPRETNDPNVRFTVTEVDSWDELLIRISELEPGVAPNELHTPSLFWDGRKDVFWHANAQQDTISNNFKATVDAYIADCSANSTVSPSFNQISEFNIAATTTAPSNMKYPMGTPLPGNDSDGCSLNASDDGMHSSNDQQLHGIPSNLSKDSKNAESTQCFVFFYSSGCPHCAAIQDYIEKELMGVANIKFTSESYEVHSSDYSRQLLAGYQHFGCDGKEAVPTIFLGDESIMHVLVGDKAIQDDLMPLLKDYQSHPTTCYDFARLINEDDVELSISSVKWGVLTAAALVDSINPCAIAVLLILLGGLVMSAVPSSPATVQPSNSGTAELDGNLAEQTKKDIDLDRNAKEDQKSSDDHMDLEVCRSPDQVTAPCSSETGGTGRNKQASALHVPEEDVSGEVETNEKEDQLLGSDGLQYKRRRAFICGMAFITSIFVAYYLLGFGLYSAVSSTEASRFVLLVLGIFIIILGIWNIKDFLCYNHGYNVEIPRSWRPLLKRLLGAVASPWGAFAAGFLVCLFELPCTGGPYLFILGLLADQSSRHEAALLLFYYNFIFVLPLILINCLVFWAVSTLERVDSWKEKYIRYLHLFAGLVLISLGVLAVVDSQNPLF